jgi:hypothetical protein
MRDTETMNYKSEDAGILLTSVESAQKCLQESRGGVQKSSENMAATIKNVLIATGVAVDDADIDAPLNYVEEVCHPALPVYFSPVLLSEQTSHILRKLADQHVLQLFAQLGLDISTHKQAKDDKSAAAAAADFERSPVVEDMRKVRLRQGCVCNYAAFWHTCLPNRSSVCIGIIIFSAPMNNDSCRSKTILHRQWELVNSCREEKAVAATHPKHNLPPHPYSRSNATSVATRKMTRIMSCYSILRTMAQVQ